LKRRTTIDLFAKCGKDCGRCVLYKHNPQKGKPYARLSVIEWRHIENCWPSPLPVDSTVRLCYNRAAIVESGVDGDE